MERAPSPFFRSISKDRTKIETPLQGSANEKIEQMLKNPENFYIPPSEDDLRKIEPNRRKREKIKKYFREAIDNFILTLALEGHEQIMETQEAKSLGIEETDYKKIRASLLSGMEEAEIEQKLGLATGTLQQIVEHVQTQPIIIKNYLRLIERERNELLKKSIAEVGDEEKQLLDPLTKEWGGFSKIGVQIKYQDVLEEIQEANKENKNNDILVFVNFDLNSFKLINDESGHDAGDAILKEVIKALTGKNKNIDGLRSDDIVARTGGDEFTVIGRVKKGDEQKFINNIVRIVHSVDNPLGGKISLTGGAYIVQDFSTPFETPNSLSDEATIYNKIRSGKDEQAILMYGPNIKPDLNNISEIKKWAEAWVSRQVKREREALETSLKKETRPEFKDQIIEELKMLDTEIAEKTRRKVSELSRQALKDVV